MRLMRARSVLAVLVAPTLVLGAGAAQASEYVPPTPEDLSSLTWTEGFDALVAKMSREYAFTKWKGVNWKDLAREYRPRIVAAEATGDQVSYLLTLREFTHELHDGHVPVYSPEGVEAAVRQEIAGGGFGLIVNRVQGGDIAATWVQRGGPAWKAGVRTGAVITSWDGRPVNKALKRTSTALSPNQPTRARVQYERLRYMVRARIGETRSLTFRNRGDKAKKVTLTAVDDRQKTLQMTDASSVLAKEGWPRDMVTTRVLPGNVGYVRVKAELDLPAELPGDHTPTLQQFQTAIRTFQKRKVNALVVDVRSNSGGMDQMVADMMGSFYRKKDFYEYQNWINAQTGRFEIWKTNDVTGEFTKRDAGIWIKPGTRPYTGPIAVLVDNGCVSSCEGVAMGLGRLSNTTVVGFYGTNGSFGMVGDGVLMPGGHQIGWPFGQSLNRAKRVQIDSRNLVGGVAPDVYVPLTVRNINRTLRGEDVVLHEALVQITK